MSRTKSSNFLLVLLLLLLLGLLCGGAEDNFGKEEDEDEKGWDDGGGDGVGVISVENLIRNAVDAVDVVGRAKRTAKRRKKVGGCDHAPNKQLCLPKAYSKFELPFTETVNVVEIGIEILDVLRINDKVCVLVLLVRLTIPIRIQDPPKNKDRPETI